MGARAKDEATSPLGVIGCLAAGFEMLGKNLSPLILPVLLDVLFWLGPRLSVAPLLQWPLASLRLQQTYDAETIRQAMQVGQLLEQFGERFNLLSILSALPLFNVPSLLAQRVPGVASPLGERQVLLVTNVLALIGWGGLLVLAGLVLGFVYMNGLASRIRATWSAKGPEAALRGTGRSSGLGKLLRVFLFTAGLLVAGMALIPPWFALIGVAAAIAPPFGLLTWAIGVGVVSYVALHLFFVIHGVLLGGRGLLRATWESIVLIHAHLPSAVGLLLLVIVIYEGLGYVWSLPFGDSWLLLIGILGNSCIATALTAATFVFYQERIGRLPGTQQLSARA